LGFGPTAQRIRQERFQLTAVTPGPLARTSTLTVPFGAFLVLIRALVAVLVTAARFAVFRGVTPTVMRTF
jgi:hypothetical protein